MNHTQLSLSVVFITYNEEYHIGQAIDNVRDIAESIYVVDSLSTDHTVDICLEKGVTVVQHPFRDFSDQWNFALENLPIKTKWTMKMDPDERLMDDIKAEISHVIANEDGFDAYDLQCRLYFMGQLLKVKTPRLLRLWKTGKSHFSAVSVNEHSVVEGKVGHLRSCVQHLDSRDLFCWVAKQNMYSSREALMRYHEDALAVGAHLFGNALERRMCFKKLFYHLPGRYVIWFLYCYFVLGAWRNGAAGWHWSQMRVFVMRLVEYKWKEMKTTGKEVSFPKPQEERFYDQRILKTELQRKLLPESVSDSRDK